MMFRKNRMIEFVPVICNKTKKKRKKGLLIFQATLHSAQGFPNSNKGWGNSTPKEVNEKFFCGGISFIGWWGSKNSNFDH